MCKAPAPTFVANYLTLLSKLYTAIAKSRSVALLNSKIL